MPYHIWYYTQADLESDCRVVGRLYFGATFDAMTQVEGAKATNV